MDFPLITNRKPMSGRDKKLVAEYLLMLCDRIIKRSWESNEIEHVGRRIGHFTRVAHELEVTAIEGND